MADDLTNAPIFTVAKPAAEYEFAEAESQVFLGLARSMRFVGMAQGIMGVALFLVAVAHTWMGGPPALLSSAPMALTGALSLVTGVWLRRAADPVERIATTRGDDIRNLMEAMRALSQMFSLQRAYFMAAAVLFVASLVAAVLAVTVFAQAMASLFS